MAVLSRQQRVARPDGEVILEVNRDITILEEAEQAVAEAAAHLKAIVETVLVLLDISLPDISGYEVFRRLKASEGLVRTVFVALSGHGYEERLRARQVGLDDYLMKPFDIKEVDRLIAVNLVQNKRM